MTETKIRDRCPTCGHDTLFIGEGGWLTCSWLPCREPGVSRAVKGLQERLERLGALPKALCALTQHVCRTCDLDENEYAERTGYNVGIEAALQSVKSALSAPAIGKSVDEHPAIGSAQDSSSSSLRGEARR